MGYDIYGIGNALVDVEYAVDDALLAAEGIVKGHMTLVDEARMEALESRLQEAGAGAADRRLSGGSAANTVYAVQGFGGRGFYSCRVAADDAGRLFLAGMADAGIGTTGARPHEGRTGRCLTLVGADAERTMATCLGVSTALAPADVDEGALAQSSYLYLEGYLAAEEAGSGAGALARELAADGPAKTCLSLSDPSMVEHCRAGLETMLGNGVHQLFCNEEEALAWARADRLDVAAAELGDIAPFVNVTLGAKGSWVVRHGKGEHAAGFPARAVDTTGAGDIYAGGVLYAATRGAEPGDAARFGNFVAAALVSRHGARLPGVAEYAALAARFPR